MFYSEKIALTRYGARISPKLLSQVGIFDGSKAWGLWVPTYPLTPNSPSARQLVVAPTHPVSWPFLLRVEAKVTDRVGSIEAILRILEDQEFNVASMSCSPTGPTHGTLLLIAEDLKTRRAFQDQKETLDHEYPHDRSKVERTQWNRELEAATRRSAAEKRDIHSLLDKHESAFQAAREFANGVASRILVRAHEIRRMIETKNEEDAGGFLHKRIVDKKWYLFNKADLSRKARRTLGASPWPRVQACDVNWMTNLPFYAIYGGAREVPIALQYRADEGLLSTTDGSILDYRSHQPRIRPSGPLSTAYPLAIGTFDTSENSLTVYPVRHSHSERRLIRVAVDYEVRAPERQHGGASRGLVRKIATRLRSHGILVRQVSHPMLEYGYSREVGRIEIVGATGKDWHTTANGEVEPKEHLRLSLLSIGQESRELDPSERTQSETERWRYTRIRRVQVSRLRATTIFVSMHFQHVRIANIEALLREAAHANGVKVEVVRTFTEPVTESVSASIHGSQALLQVIFDRSDSAQTTNRRWLDFEYGLARGRRLPVMRMIDTSSPSSGTSSAETSFDRDHCFKEFRLDVADDELRKSFDEAIRILISRLEPGWHAGAEDEER